jgi:hypothetical protein
MRPQWEYLIVQRHFPDHSCEWSYTFAGQVEQGKHDTFDLLLGKLGSTGWELVAVVDEGMTVLYFKRPVHPSATKHTPPHLGLHQVTDE